MDNATSAENGGTPRGTARRIRARLKGPKVRARAKEKARTEKAPNRQEGSQEVKEVECHHA